jgi:hypothetical protein
VAEVSIFRLGWQKKISMINCISCKLGSGHGRLIVPGLAKSGSGQLNSTEIFSAMKKIKRLASAVLVLTLAALHPATAKCDSAGRNLVPVQQKTPFVSLENLEAEYFPAHRVVAVKGSIKNISSSTLRGNITLYLLSSSGMVLSAFDLPVNDHRPFRGGEIVSFDTAINVSSISGAYQVSVEFTKD